MVVRKRRKPSAFGKNKPLLQRIERVVDELIDNEELFTLLDISEKVKADGGEWVSHSVMKPEIESMLAQKYATSVSAQNYTYDNIKVKTVVGGKRRTTDARLFYPATKDPSTYKGGNQTATAPGKRKVASHHPTNTARSKKTGRTKRKSDGYIEVPKTVWEAARFKPGETIIVDVGPNSMTIYRNSSKSKYSKSTLQKKAQKPTSFVAAVPAAGRFRLSPKWLKASNMAKCDVDFSQYTDKIVVSPKV